MDNKEAVVETVSSSDQCLDHDGLMAVASADVQVLQAFMEGYGFVYPPNYDWRNAYDKTGSRFMYILTDTQVDQPEVSGYATLVTNEDDFSGRVRASIKLYTAGVEIAEAMALGLAAEVMKAATEKDLADPLVVIDAIVPFAAPEEVHRCAQESLAAIHTALVGQDGFTEGTQACDTLREKESSSILTVWPAEGYFELNQYTRIDETTPPVMAYASPLFSNENTYERAPWDDQVVQVVQGLLGYRRKALESRSWGDGDEQQIAYEFVGDGRPMSVEALNVVLGLMLEPNLVELDPGSHTEYRIVVDTKSNSI